MFLKIAVNLDANTESNAPELSGAEISLFFSLLMDLVGRDGFALDWIHRHSVLCLQRVRLRVRELVPRINGLCHYGRLFSVAQSVVSAALPPCVLNFLSRAVQWFALQTSRLVAKQKGT